MAMLDQIVQQKQRISERLTLVDAERAKLSVQLDELDVAERALKRFSGNGAAREKPRKERVAKAAKATGTKPKTADAKPKTALGHEAKSSSLGDATLKAVQAHAKGASTDQLRKYLSRKFGLTVRPNHLGSALQRHRRAGRLENVNPNKLPRPASLDATDPTGRRHSGLMTRFRSAKTLPATGSQPPACARIRGLTAVVARRPPARDLRLAKN